MRKKRKLLYILGAVLLAPLAVAGVLVLYSYLSYPKMMLQEATGVATRIVDGQLVTDDKLFAFWIGDAGPTGPLFEGEKQIPFVCSAFRYGLGQPIVDNEDGDGSAIFPELFGYPLIWLKPVGYSKYCSLYTRVDYFYYSDPEGKFLPLSDPLSRPNDLAYIAVNGKGVKNKDIPFIVRLERGTINRFIYSVAMLAPYAESLQSPQTLNKNAWNGKLVYKFQGGIGLGHFQGSFSLNKRHALHYESLKRGFAVAYSTGTKSATHYNLKLAEETAFMVKRHFEVTYGKPQYTVGIGGSGGAVQQYVIAQNNPNIIDAAIPQASYPDMITQTINVADCELLERYFDYKYMENKNSHWANWLNRMAVEGTAANQTAAIEKWKRSPAPSPGSSECVAGWRGTVPMVFNPHWTHEAYFKTFRLFRFPEAVTQNIKWTHWNDLKNIYPTDEHGFAPNSWDNVGVQYGLLALRKGEIDKQMFLELNACVGGWKQPDKMIKGNYPWNRTADQSVFDPWDQANMNLSENCKSGDPAPRTEGNLNAINIAYSSGHVFTGGIKIPVIDIRWYLEPILNMHHGIASFSARSRIKAKNGHADNHVIWVSECAKLDVVNLKSDCHYEPTGDALDDIDQWMENKRMSPEKSAEEHKPQRAVDSCFKADGTLIYAGDDAWDGVMDGQAIGVCSEKFPMYSTSRLAAGAAINNDIFKCALKPVEVALVDGSYGSVQFSEQEVARLQEIFPSGVCDYSKPDMGLPVMNSDS